MNSAPCDSGEGSWSVIHQAGIQINDEAVPQGLDNRAPGELTIDYADEQFQTDKRR